MRNFNKHIENKNKDVNNNEIFEQKQRDTKITQTFTQKEKNFKKENLKHYNCKRKKQKSSVLPAMGSLADGGGRLRRGKGHEKEKF